METPVQVIVHSGPHKGIGGWVADMIIGPLTGKARLRIVDLLREISDEDAGVWVNTSDCEEIWW